MVGHYTESLEINQINMDANCEISRPDYDFHELDREEISFKPHIVIIESVCVLLSLNCDIKP